MKCVGAGLLYSRMRHPGATNEDLADGYTSLINKDLLFRAILLVCACALNVFPHPFVLLPIQ